MCRVGRSCEVMCAQSLLVRRASSSSITICCVLLLLRAVRMVRSSDVSIRVWRPASGESGSARAPTSSLRAHTHWLQPTHCTVWQRKSTTILSKKNCLKRTRGEARSRTLSPHQHSRASLYRRHCSFALPAVRCSALSVLRAETRPPAIELRV